jgi:CheY-like chemotaxis protein
VAHDFNNMLSVILGYTELALDKIPEKDPLREDLDEVMQAANRSTDIARQLLAFARRQTISPKVMDLNETVEEMLKMLRRLIGEDIDLSWQPGGGLWPVNMDPSQIDQIMANLCVNSRDAIGGVGKITIETENVTLDKEDCAHRDELMPGDYVLLVVSDTGRGMDAATRERIFEPFFTTKGVGEGTGLGLSTIYGIVKQNKGDIQVYSEPGDGTTFRIYLPRHVGETHSVPDREVPRMLMGQGETVLVAEDEDAILKLAARMLERLGYTVLMAAGPVVAEQVAKTHAGPIDLLMTDVVMPDMSGRDLADRLSILYPDLRVLYMSGYTANVIAHRGVLEENMQFISKPFSQMDLARKVREALE